MKSGRLVAAKRFADIIFVACLFFQSDAYADSVLPSSLWDGLTFTGVVQDGAFTHTESDVVSGLSVSGTHIYTGPSTGTFNWSGVIGPPLGTISPTIIGGGTVNDVFGTRNFSLTAGGIQFDFQTRNWRMFWNATDSAPGSSGIGGVAFAPLDFNRVVAGNAVKVSTANGKTTIKASFTPNYGLTLQQAAQLGGFINFEWLQTVTIPDPSPYFANNFPQGPQVQESGTVRDPPKNGGYTYELVKGYPKGDFSYPFYYTVPELLNHEAGGLSLTFKDSPADPCLPGGNSTGEPGCFGHNAVDGSALFFQTDLVGILPSFVPGNDCLEDLTCIVLAGFDWTDTFNGTNGNVATTKSDTPVDFGSGTGGITLLDVNGEVVTPLPGALPLFATGLGGLVLLGWRRKRKAT